MPSEWKLCIFLKVGLGEAAKRSVGTGNNQLPDMSSFAASLSGSGWQKLPGGLIIQWGQVLSNSGGFAPWTYPIAFPSACFHVYATPFVGASANNFTLTTIGNPGLTAVTTACYVNGVQSSTVGQVGVRYLAIGN
ncbi:gp53-like domain-containing protein [Enterobacter roggenkampii]|uniref:gp53-like domain-containing protein n=1 Tax=Enterobacter roggenkampii TaxID=1812935 RepID=UPI003BCFB691